MRIGGSNIAGICGISPWSTPLDEYLKITGQITTPDNPAMYWGRALEPIIRQKYIEETGRIVHYNTDTRLLGVPIKHPRLPYVSGSLDGISTTPDDDVADRRVLEIKTARDRRHWGEGVPGYYLCQVQMYMACTGYKMADVAVLFGAADFDVFEVERNDEDIEAIECAVEDFWNNHVFPRIPPECTTPSDRNTMWPASSDRAIQATEEIEALISAIKEKESAVSKIESEIEYAKASIKDAMQDADSIISLSGKPIITWRSSKDSISFDQKALQKALPGIWKQFSVKKPGSRRFVIK